MTTLYWQVYRNLEKEFLQLAEVIHIDDNQLGIYSMRIADLLMRSVVEIEALSKELYLSSGGEILQNSDMYFDTVCMKYLNELWAIEKKVVMVVAPTIYISQDVNKVLNPLHKASKRGSSSAIWNRAYQAIKHNRAKELQQGNVRNLLHSLAALYILNLYYKNTEIPDIAQGEEKNVDSSFGSALFAVKIHIPQGLTSDGEYHKENDFDECVYICDFEAESKAKSLKAIKALDSYVSDTLQPIMTAKIQQQIERGLDVSEQWLQSARIEAMKEVLPIRDFKLSKMINDNLKFRYNVVLNKNQY